MTTPLFASLQRAGSRIDSLCIQPFYALWVSASLVWVASVWAGVVVGVSSTYGLPWWSLLLLLLLWLGLASLSLLRGQQLRRGWVRLVVHGALLISTALAGGGVGHVFSRLHPALAPLQTPLDASYHNTTCTAVGRLFPNEQGWNMNTVTLCDVPHRITLKLSLPYQQTTPPLDATWQAGQTVVLKGRIRLPHPPLFSGDFNEAHYLASQHQWGTLTSQRVLPLSHVATASPSVRLPELSWLESLNALFYNTLKPWQTAFLHRLNEAYGSTPEANLLGGMVLGNRTSPLPNDLNTAFLHTGQTHLVAASGMNIAIIAGALWLLGRCLGLAPVWQAPLTVLGVLAYCWMTGWPPSIKRAGMVWMLALCLRPLLPSTTPTLWLLWGVGLLACLDPACLLSLGFQLSVLTTFGLVQWLTWLEARFPARFPRFSWQWGGYALGQSIATAAVAQLWAMPLILSAFQYLPLHSVIWNAVSALVVVPLTFGGFVTMGCVGLERVASLFGFVGSGVAHGLHALTLLLTALLKPLLDAFIGWTFLGDALQTEWPWLGFYSLHPSPTWLLVSLGLFTLPTLLACLGGRWPQRQSKRAFWLYGCGSLCLAVVVVVGVGTLLPQWHPLTNETHTRMGNVQIDHIPHATNPIRLTLDHWPNHQACKQLQQALLRGNVLAYTQQGTPWELHIVEGPSRWPHALEGDAFLAWVEALPPQSKAGLTLVLPHDTPRRWLYAPAFIGVGASTRAKPFGLCNESHSACAMRHRTLASSNSK